MFWRILPILVCLQYFSSLTNAQNQEGISNRSGTRSSAASVDALSTGLNPAEFGQGSVSLNTGDVSFPMGLGVLSADGNLSFSLNATYSSNVEQQVETWNLESPTGLLGLGWSVGSNKIIVDHKETGTKVDNDYYWVQNGSPAKLIFLRYIEVMYPPYLIQTKKEEYRIASLPSVIIIYDPYFELWTITDEEGHESIFGGLLQPEQQSWNGQLQGEPPPSNGNSIEWGVKWGNWIGNSSMDNQENFPIAYNLWKIRNLNSFGSPLEKYLGHL